MDASLHVVERINGVRSGVTGCMRQTDQVMLGREWLARCGRLVFKAVLSGLWPEDFGERLQKNAIFRNVVGSPGKLFRLWGSCRSVKRSARRTGG